MKQYEKIIFTDDNANVSIEELAFLQSTGETFVTRTVDVTGVKLKFVEQCDGKFVWHQVYINDEKEVDGELAYADVSECKQNQKYYFPIYTEWD